MKKKLLAVVLSVIMTVALLVPMISASADASALTVTLGDVTDYDDDLIQVTVKVTNVAKDILGARFIVVNSEGIDLGIDASDASSYVMVADPEDDTSVRYEKYNAVKKTYTYSSFGDPTVGIANLGSGLDAAVVEKIPTGATGYRVVLDATVGKEPTTTGNLVTVLFPKPTTPGTYHYKLVWIDSTDSDAKGKHVVTVTNEISNYVVACTNHVPVDDLAVEATCTSTGKTAGSHCSVCGAVIVAQTDVAKKNHTRSDVITVTEPTCTVKGVGKIECTVCHAVLEENVEIAALGHNYVDQPGTTATCTVAGTRVQKCTRCNDVKQDEVSALGHDWVIDKAVPATCTEKGLTEGKHCNRCSEFVAQTQTEALGHNVVDDPAVAPTCELDGKTAGSHCSRCNEVIVAQTAVAKLGHVVVNDLAVAATCTTAGKTAGTHCSRCNEVLVAQENVAALGHVVVNDAAVAATCTTAGKTAGTHCSRCNEVLVAQENVAALGHDFENGKVEVVKEATIEAGGQIKITCSRCSETKLVDTEKLVSKVEKADDITIASDKGLPADLTKVENKDVVVKTEGKNEALETFNFDAQSVPSLDGATATVSLSVKKYDGKYNNLSVVRVNADGSTTKVNATFNDGVAVFTGDLSAVYAVVGEKVVVATGDNFSMVLYIVLALIAAVGIAVVAKKKLAR